ncbi:MAG: hypothetical protein BMS9Abin23_0127 [Thermodesulfobacteriota bacterium]|nr:MAG: hypothetical protein BMS9Abin23_0127 [Thermodesulfobacteriota bacterium]
MEGKKTYGMNGAGRYFIVLLGVLFLALAGCGGSKEEKASTEKAPAAVSGQEALPKEHPAVDKTTEDIAKASHSAIKTQKDVKISKEVQEKWKEVTIKITDNASKETKSVNLKIGSTVQLTDDGYQLKVEVFVPDYAISENHIESRSNEPNNTAVLVDILKGNEVVTRGWIFKDYPEFNSYNSQRFSLVLVEP